MLNLISCEMKKLKNSKIIILCIIGAFAVPAMMLIESIQTHFEHPERIFTLSDIYDNSLLYAMLLMNMMICVAIISYIFSREYLDNTLKTVLPIPVSRIKLLIGKYAVTLLLTLLINIITWAGILLFSGIYHSIFTISEFSLTVALNWLMKFLYSGVLIFFTATPFSYLAMKTKGFVAPMVISAAIVMGSAAISNQNLAALYPWTATFFLVKGSLTSKGYPILLSIIIILFISLLGFLATFKYFSNEDLK